MDGIPIHVLKALACPQKPDKSRPCISHRRLQLIHRVGLFEFLRFLKQFRITANACYNFHQKSYCHPALRECYELARGLPAYCAVYDDWLYLLAKVRLSFGMRKKKNKSIFLAYSKRSTFDAVKGTIKF